MCIIWFNSTIDLKAKLSLYQTSLYQGYRQEVSKLASIHLFHTGRRETRVCFRWKNDCRDYLWTARTYWGPCLSSITVGHEGFTLRFTETPVDSDEEEFRTTASGRSGVVQGFQNLAKYRSTGMFQPPQHIANKINEMSHRLRIWQGLRLKTSNTRCDSNSYTRKVQDSHIFGNLDFFSSLDWEPWMGVKVSAI